MKRTALALLLLASTAHAQTFSPPPPGTGLPTFGANNAWDRTATPVSATVQPFTLGLLSVAQPTASFPFPGVQPGDFITPQWAVGSAPPTGFGILSANCATAGVIVVTFLSPTAISTAFTVSMNFKISR